MRGKALQVVAELGTLQRNARRCKTRSYLVIQRWLTEIDDVVHAPWPVLRIAHALVKRDACIRIAGLCFACVPVHSHGRRVENLKASEYIASAQLEPKSTAGEQQVALGFLDELRQVLTEWPLGFFLQAVQLGGHGADGIAPQIDRTVQHRHRCICIDGAFECVVHPQFVDPSRVRCDRH